MHLNHLYRQLLQTVLQLLSHPEACVLCYHRTTYYSFDELKEAIVKYIKYYNEKRIKEKLGWMSPVQYRLNTLAA